MKTNHKRKNLYTSGLDYGHLNLVRRIRCELPTSYVNGRYDSPKEVREVKVYERKRR